MEKPDAIITTQPEYIRLECLRMAAQRLDLDPERVVERAEVFVKFVGASTPSRTATPGKGTKKDNPLS